MKHREAVIFDCDGVLFDSQQANLAYYNRVFGHFDHPLVTDPHSPEAQICHTASSPVVLSRLLEPSVLEEALEFAREIDYREFLPLMTEAAGLRSGLSRLAAVLPLAIATNRGGSMQAVLAHFDLSRHFEVVVTSCDVNRPKPAPDMLLLAASQLRVRTESCVFVGDSELDRQAAAGAACSFIAYGAGAESDCRVGSHVELADLLLG